MECNCFFNYAHLQISTNVLQAQMTVTTMRTVLTLAGHLNAGVFRHTV